VLYVFSSMEEIMNSCCTILSLFYVNTHVVMLLVLLLRQFHTVERY